MRDIGRRAGASDPPRDHRRPPRVPRRWRPLYREPSLWLACASVAAATYLIGIGISRYPLAREMEADPERMTCAELGTSGPRSSRHVLLTDYEIAETGALQTTTTSTYGISQSSRSEEWIPIAPRGALGRTHRVVLKRSAPPFGMGISDFPGPRVEVPLDGCVRPSDEIPTEIARMLEFQYPGLHVSSCLLFESPAYVIGTDVCTLAIGAGVALLGTAAWLAFRLRRLRAPPSMDEGSVASAFE